MEGPCDRLEEVRSALGRMNNFTTFNLCNDTDNDSDIDSQIASEHLHVDTDTQHTDSGCKIVDANTHTDSDCILADANTHTDSEQKPSSDEDSDLDRTPVIHFVPTATVRQQTQPKRPFTSVMYVHSSTDDSTPRLTQEREQQTNSDEDSDLDRTPLINFVPDLDRTPIIHFVPTATVRQQTQPKRPFTSVMYVHSSTDDSTPRLTQEREQQTNSDEDSDLDKTPLINFVPDLDRTPIIHFVPTATVRQQTRPKRLFTTKDSD